MRVILAVLAILIGGINIKDFFAFKRGVSLSIPESAKPGFYRRVREIVQARSLLLSLSGAIVLIAIVTLGQHKLQEKEGRWLKLVSGAVMLILGMVLLLRPGWLGE